MRLVVAGSLFLATAIALVVGTAILLPGTPLDRIWDLNRPAYAGFQRLGWWSGILLLILGACTAITGAGLLRHKPWAWWMAIAIFAANGLGDLVNLFTGTDHWKSVAGTVIAGVFVVLVIRLGRN